MIEAVTAELALAAARASGPVPSVILSDLIHRGREAAGSQEAYDYSPQAVAARWAAGLADGWAMLASLGTAPAPRGTGLTIPRLDAVAEEREEAAQAA